MDELWFFGWLDELAALNALQWSWQVDDAHWSAWLDAWAQARPVEHRRTLADWQAADPRERMPG